MEWSSRRKFLYGAAVVVFLSIFSIYFFRDMLFKSPTCSDGKQNGFEIGVDCGGSCALKCTQEVSPLSVMWSRQIMTSSSTYDLVAMVSNKNLDNASRYMAYKFTLFTEQGTIISIINGTTTAPIDGDFPIILQKVHVEGTPVRLVTELVDQPHFTVNAKPSVPTLKVTGIRYEEGQIPRVLAVVSNTKQVTLSNTPVRVILFDAADNAYAAGETIIPFLDKEESRNISFTWPYPFAKEPVKIRIYPILSPFIRVQ